MDQELLFASQDGRLNDVIFSLKRGANVNITDPNTGETPLHIASRNGHLEVVEELLTIPEINPNIRDNNGRVPLHSVLIDERSELSLQLYYNSGSDPYFVNEYVNKVPLRRPIEDERTAVLNELLELGTSLDFATDYSNAVYKRRANRNKRLEIVKKLLSVPDINPNVRNKDGQTPLYLASRYDSLEVVKELLLNGADPNIGDSMHSTPLHIASGRKYLEIVEQLLLYGADPNIVNLLGSRPVKVTNSPEIIYLLNNYLPSLQTRSIVSIMNNKINVKSVPKTFFSS